MNTNWLLLGIVCGAILWATFLLVWLPWLFRRSLRRQREELLKNQRSAREWLDARSQEGQRRDR